MTNKNPYRRALQSTSGFTLIEAAVVLGIAMVVMALTAPLLLNAMSNIKLASSAQSVAALMQDTRMRSAKDNKSYSLSCNDSSGAVPASTDLCSVLFVDINGNHLYDKNSGGTFAKMELDVQVAGAAKLMTGDPGTPVSTGALGFTPNPYASAVTPPELVRFSPRGLPCLGSACATTNSSGQIGYVYYLTTTNNLGTVQYAAVSVSPGGRIKTWKYGKGGWN